MNIQEILETCIYANDLKAAEEFYQNVLGLELYAKEAGRHVFFRCGKRMFLIFKPDSTLEGGALPAHGAKGPGHVAFAIAETENEKWKNHLKERGIKIELETQWPSGGYSIYFRDPAGNSLELANPKIWGDGSFAS